MDFPLQGRPGVAVDPEYLAMYRSSPLVPVQLRGGREALLVTRYADVRTVMADDRFSREAWQNGTLFARKTEALALATSDAPTHTYRRKAVQGRFTARQAAAARPEIEKLADRLIDGLEAAGPPADLAEGFTLPLSYGVICDMLGIPDEDMETFLPWVSAMMSAGRYPADEIAASHEHMYGYFAGQLDLRREDIAAGTPGPDILTELLTAGELSEEEITIFGFGLLIAGCETTANFLLACILEILSHPALPAELGADASRVPAVVDECLRWTWFGGTGGQPHVVLEKVELGGTTLAPGQVVIPMPDAANRDPSVFENADEFCPDRTPNPHLGFGHGRHMCLGAAHARVEVEVGLAALLRRLPGLELAVAYDELDWRHQMFIRGVWSLPVTWSTR